MKVLNFVPLVFLLIGDASAQVTSGNLEAPEVTVIDFKWHKETYIPALYEDPMLPHEEQSGLVREQKATVRGNVVRIQQGEPAKPIPTRMPLDSRTFPGLSVKYRFEAKIKNNGKKSIREILWEYLLLEPENEVEVGRHQFTSKVNLGAGKTADLIGRSMKPPTRVVDVSKAGQDLRGKYSERVTITRLMYSDGSSWQRPLN